MQTGLPNFVRQINNSLRLWTYRIIKSRAGSPNGALYSDINPAGRPPNALPETLTHKSRR